MPSPWSMKVAMLSIPQIICCKHCSGLALIMRVGQSAPAPTSAPTWMDGALIVFSFLSLCHPRLTFFVCPFSALISTKAPPLPKLGDGAHLRPKATKQEKEKKELKLPSAETW